MSVKVALFSYNNAHNLIDTVNDFCKDKNVIDIQYQSMVASCTINDRVLVIYEDENGGEK